LLVPFVVIWGVAVVADSAQLSALVAEYNSRHQAGTALTVQTCAVFLLTMVSIRLLPVARESLGCQWGVRVARARPDQRRTRASRAAA
jgi:hypothetical protein